VLILLYLLPRNGSLVHLGAALTEISCLRKDWGKKKKRAFPITGERGGKSSSRSKINAAFFRRKDLFMGELSAHITLLHPLIT